MTDDKYKQLEATFTKFNNAIMVFYDELCDLALPVHKKFVLEALQIMLQDSGALFKLVADSLFANTK